jgi:effector-binding domain-containing protein
LLAEVLSLKYLIKSNMRAVKIIVITILVIVSAFFSLAIISPTEYNVERSVVIDAERSVILPNVSNLRKMQEWSPWTDYDAEMKNIYSGVDGEVGSINRREGNDEVGVREQEILSITDARIELELRFIEPWEAVNRSYVELDEVDGGIKVSWGFDGVNPFPMNAMSFFMDMDKMLGPDFENGLNKLKVICESTAAVEMNSNISILNFKAKTYVAKRSEVKLDEIRAFYKENIGKILNQIMKTELEMTGKPTGLFFSYDEEKGVADMAAAIAVNLKKTSFSDFEVIDVLASRAVQYTYFGSYDGTGNGHSAIAAYLKTNNLKEAGIVMEEYITDTSLESDTSKWQTNIIYIIKE